MTVIIRNKRNTGWFYLDNEYLNGYAKLLKPLTSLVYLSLCRHANEYTQECFPSMNLIAEEFGISSRTVIGCIKELEDWNIIAVAREKDEGGRQMNNVYTLLDKSMWKSKPSENGSLGKPSENDSTKPSENDDKSRVKHVHTKDTNINNTNINNTKEEKKAKFSTNGAEIIKAMEIIDPKNSKYYGNVPQREACEDLLKFYGKENVLNFITFIKANMTKIFNPPTTPAQLRDNWQRVASQVGFEINKQKKNTPEVFFSQ